MTGPETHHILICGPNWLGDSIMSMPAIRMFKRGNPSCRITILVKGKLTSLWRMHRAVDETIEMREGLAGTLATCSELRKSGFVRSYIFPNSFRSALLPFLAGVPIRIGHSGRLRSWMLTDCVDAHGLPGGEHQLREYMGILGVKDQPGPVVDGPVLRLPQDVLGDVRKRHRMAEDTMHVGLIPGAARGPSKRWPVENYVAVGRHLVETTRCRLLVFGTKEEEGLCSQVAVGIGERVENVAGKTSFPEFAALLSVCGAVVTNDSGGMHLAAAMGTRVVAVFGITDPKKTGPLGEGHRIILRKGVQRSRDVERHSAEAQACLQEISPERVCRAVEELISPVV